METTDSHDVVRGLVQGVADSHAVMSRRGVNELEHG